MAWFKCDDTLAFNAKVLAAGNEAIGLWVRAGSWCASQMTDGVVPHSVVVALANGEANAEALASRLLEAHLWERFDKPCKGYRFHDWSEYQPSAQEVRERRRKRAEAGRKGGIKSGVTRRDATAIGEANGEANAEALASRLLEAKPNPVPSRPVPIKPPPSEGVQGEHLAAGDALPAPSAQAEAKPKATRGKRLDPDFIPSEKSRKTILTEFPTLNLQLEHEKFADHWKAQPGQKGVKLDWDATWRNWMRRAGEQHQPRRSTTAPTEDQFARLDELQAKAAAYDPLQKYRDQLTSREAS